MRQLCKRRLHNSAYIRQLPLSESAIRCSRNSFAPAVVTRKVNYGTEQLELNLLPPKAESDAARAELPHLGSVGTTLAEKARRFLG